ncbi:MAG TPA: hypothetical protein VFL28_10650 [bacterium]|nr:hypothetical protein [bacterium]
MVGAMNVIKPYRWGGTWVFDDPVRGLRARPVLLGSTDAIAKVWDQAASRSAQRLMIAFAAAPFQWPGYRFVLNWAEERDGGHWYRLNGLVVQCPALLRYFDAAPRSIYCQVTVMRTPFSIFQPQPSHVLRPSLTGRQSRP